MLLSKPLKWWICSSPAKIQHETNRADDKPVSRLYPSLPGEPSGVTLAEKINDTKPSNDQGQPTRVSSYKKTLNILLGYPDQSTFRSLEIHFKWRYKICICSVILADLESFRSYKDFSIIFPKILDAI